MESADQLCYGCLFHSKVNTLTILPYFTILEFKFVVSRESQGFKFFLHTDIKRVRREDNVKISCQTNDPKANVTLETRNKLGTRLIQTGQNFTILNILPSDNKYYSCKAFNGTASIKLGLGSFMVLPGQFFVLFFFSYIFDMFSLYS